MAVTRTEAEELALAAAGPEFELDGTVVEASYGWVFSLRVVQRAGPPSVEDLVIGGPDHVVVESDGGRVFPYSSCALWHSSEPIDTHRQALLEAYERGYRFEHYDLTISAVADLTTTASTAINRVVATGRKPSSTRFAPP